MKKYKTLFSVGLFTLLSLSFISTSVGRVFAATAPAAVSQNIIVTTYVKPAVTFLTAGVGLVITAVIIVAGIQYSASSGNPQALSAARNRILNALLALLTFAFIYAFLNFIIPGGVVGI
jgi:hypothetical protein